MSVEYFVNGVQLSSKEVYVSASHGLVGLPERKEVLSHDWPEFHGRQYDTGAPARVAERHILLECFVAGDDWSDLLSNYRAVRDEFLSAGLQRLVVKPFSYTELVFDVMLEGESYLEKRFQDGQMIGVFHLSLVEPNPVKTTYKYTGTSFQLKYNSAGATLVNIDGSTFGYSGNIDESYVLSAGTHYITVVGEISSVTTNGTKL